MSLFVLFIIQQFIKIKLIIDKNYCAGKKQRARTCLVLPVKFHILTSDYCPVECLCVCFSPHLRVFKKSILYILFIHQLTS